MHSLLENQKPPSIMENSSLMSHSTGSITSEISDIAYDQVPIRKSSSDLVAAVALNCAKEISNLVESCLNSSTEGNNSSCSTSQSIAPSDLDSTQLAVTKFTDKLLMEQRTNLTYDMEPAPGIITLPRTSGANTTTVTIDRVSSTDTRTYNKNDHSRTINTADKTIEVEQMITSSECLVDSDTDISEVLPLDDVKVINSTNIKSPIKQLPNGPLPAYNNPMDSAESRGNNQSTPPQPRYQFGLQKLLRDNFQLTDDSSEGEMIVGYTQSLKSHRSHYHRKRGSSATREESGAIFLNSGQSHIGSIDDFEHSNSNPVPQFHSLGRASRTNRSKAVKDFEDKELMFTAKHRNVITANHAQFFQNKLNQNNHPIKTASKYFDRHAAALSSMTHEDLSCTASDGSCSHCASNTVNGHNQSHIPLPSSSKRINQDTNNNCSKSNKSKSSKEKTTSFFSKLSNSFSSHNLGSNSNSSGYSSPTGNGSTVITNKYSLYKINSKIASLFKRSKSTYDKLDHDAHFISSNSEKNMNISDFDRSNIGRRYIKS